MRVTFAETLAELAASDRRIVLLTGDVGFMALDAFAERHPDRFFNAGVAEQTQQALLLHRTAMERRGYLD